MITPAGPVPDMHLQEPSELVHCALDESFTGDVVRDLGCAAAPREFRAGIQEKSIQRILGLLVEELRIKETPWDPLRGISRAGAGHEVCVT